MMQVLCVGIDRDELNTFDFGIDHVVEGILAGTADTDHFYSSKRLNFGFDLGHFSLAVGQVG